MNKGIIEKERMSIILFTNSLDFGGASTFFIRMNDAFNDENIKCNIVAFNNEREKQQQQNLLKLSIYKRIKFLRNKCKKQQCESIITNYGLETLIAKIATVGLNKKVKVISVVHIRAIMFIPETMNKLKRFIFKLLIKLSFRICDKCVAVSNDLKNELIEQKWVNKNKVVTIYNPVIKDNIEFKSRNINKDKEIHIGLIGWIWDIKNQEEAIKAIYELKDKKIKLHLIGGIKDKDYYNKLKILINELKLEEQVFFEGLKENIFEEFKNIDILILTSKTEALPTVIIEALASGVPVISRNCDVGPREILKNGKYGYLYEKDDILNLVRNIELVINNEKLYYNLSEKGLERAKDFTYNRAVLNYKKLLEIL